MIDNSVPTIVMLVVEDNPADVVFFREAMECAQVQAVFHVVGDGDKALQFLRREARFADAPRPDVIVLDLNLPMRSGQEVLLEVSRDSDLKLIPVAILTSSASDRGLCDLYPSGHCLYFTKTDDFERLQGIVREIAEHASYAAVRPPVK